MKRQEPIYKISTTQLDIEVTEVSWEKCSYECFNCWVWGWK